MILILILIGITVAIALYLEQFDWGKSVSVPDSVIPPTFTIYGPSPEVLAEIAKTPKIWSKETLTSLIRKTCAEENFAYSTIALGVASVESSFNPGAYNPEISATRGNQPDSIGLMGVQFKTAKAMMPEISNEKDLYDPEINARAGVRYLKYLFRKWQGKLGNEAAIQMYNLGETRYLAGSRASRYATKVMTYGIS